MKVSKNIELTIFLFFLLLCVLTISIWFKSGNLFIGAEEGIVFYRIDYIFDKMVSTSWLSWFLGMPYFSDLSKVPFYFLLNILFSFGAPVLFLQIMTFFLILFGATVASFYLFKVIFKEIPGYRLAAFFGALFYLCNPYVISQVWGRGLYQQFFAYLYYPAFLLFVVLFFKTNKIVYLLINLLIAYVLSAAMGNPTYFISLWIVIFLYWFYQIWDSRSSFTIIIQRVTQFVCFFLCWIILNSWWLIVTVLYAPSAYLNSVFVLANSLEALRSLSDQNPFVNVIRLYHGPHFESGVYGTIYQNHFFILLSFFPVFVLFFSFRFFKKLAFKYFFTLFLLGLFVCLGLNPPFGKLFEIIFTYLPVLQIFRNPYEKFGLVFLLAYSALFGLGLLALFQLLKNSLKSRIIVIVLAGLFFGLYLWPFWLGRMISWGTEAQIPNRYAYLKQWIITMIISSKPMI